MTQLAARKVFVNLPVRNLEASKAFFTKLGFTFNPQFTDERAACMVLSEEGYVMLLAAPFFETFTKKALCDATTHTEVLIAVSCESREEVDRLVKTALEAGGTPAMDPADHGFMYYHTFHDLDGHHWELLWMDPAAVPPQ